MKYRLTEEAAKDIRGIVHHIRFVQKSPQNARLVAARLKHQFELLLEIPQLGHQRSELHDDDALVIEVSGVLVMIQASSRSRSSGSFMQVETFPGSGRDAEIFFEQPLCRIGYWMY